jgi:hypothetical protein
MYSEEGSIDHGLYFVLLSFLNDTLSYIDYIMSNWRLATSVEL